MGGTINEKCTGASYLFQGSPSCTPHYYHIYKMNNSEFLSLNLKPFSEYVYQCLEFVPGGKSEKNKNNHQKHQKHQSAMSSGRNGIAHTAELKK